MKQKMRLEFKQNEQFEYFLKFKGFYFEIKKSRGLFDFYPKFKGVFFFFFSLKLCIKIKI